MSAKLQSQIVTNVVTLTMAMLFHCERMPAQEAIGPDVEQNSGLVTEGFQLSISLSKQIYELGEPIIASLRIRNVNESQRTFRGISNSAEDFGLFLVGSDRLLVGPPPAKDAKFLKLVQRGSSHVVSMPPRTTWEYKKQLTDSFLIDKEGEYVLYATRIIPKLSGEGVSEVRSANVIFRVVEADASRDKAGVVSAPSGISSAKNQPSDPKNAAPPITSKKSTAATPSVAPSAGGSGDSDAHKYASPAKVDTASKTLATGSGLQPRDWFFGVFLLAVLAFVGAILLRARARSKI